MSRYISTELRNQVSKAADNCCEYCLIPESISFYKFHIDHIISIRHGGDSSFENLAFSCQICNQNKGTDIATILPSTGDTPVRFFHPRSDIWKNHFSLSGNGKLEPKSKIGEATIKHLQLNHPDSILERKELIRIGKVDKYL